MVELPKKEGIISFVKINQATILALGVLALIIVLFSKNFLLPQIKQFIIFSKKLNEITQLVNKMESSKESQIALKKELEVLEGKFRSYENGILTLGQEETFLSDLSRFARICYVKLMSVQPLPKIQKKEFTSENNYLEYPYQIRIKGGYHQLGKFINQLENNKNQFIKINRVNMIANSQDAWEHDVDLEISIFVKS